MANTQTSVPVFTSGQVLTAQQQTEINTGIPVFADSTARDAAFGGTGEKTLAEGQFAFLEDTNATQFYDGAVWQAVTGARVGQVVSTLKSDTFSTASTSYADVTGMSVSITPTLATSKVLVMVQYVTGMSGDIIVFTQLLRDSTALSIGDAASSRTRASNAMSPSAGSGPNTYVYNSDSIIFLDSPATTSATTYKLQMSVNTGTGYLNRSGQDTDNLISARTASNITVMEVIV